MVLKFILIIHSPNAVLHVDIVRNVREKKRLESRITDCRERKNDFTDIEFAYNHNPLKVYSSLVVPEILSVSASQDKMISPRTAPNG